MEIVLVCNAWCMRPKQGSKLSHLVLMLDPAAELALKFIALPLSLKSIQQQWLLQAA